MVNETLHAWYSQKAVDAGCGSSIYATSDGREIEVTFVHKTKDGTGYRWDDAVYRGVVVKWIRTGVRGSYDPLDFPSSPFWDQ